MTHKQKVLRLLSDNQPHSHLEGYRLGVMLHSRVADLRKDGYTVKCWAEKGAWWYQLFGSVREPLGTGNAASDGAPGFADRLDIDGPPEPTVSSAETAAAAGPGPFSPPAGARQLTVFEAA